MKGTHATNCECQDCNPQQIIKMTFTQKLIKGGMGGEMKPEYDFSKGVRGNIEKVHRMFFTQRLINEILSPDFDYCINSMTFAMTEKLKILAEKAKEEIKEKEAV